MELGQHQMQIALSLILILGAALVALVVDLLKGNNEQLRELTIELKVRREEEDKRFQLMAPHAPAEKVPADKVPADKVPAEKTHVTSEAMAMTIAATHETSARPAGRPVAAPAPKRPEREKRVMAPEALAAIQRGERLAASPKPSRVANRVPAEHPAKEHPATEHPVTEHLPVPQSEPMVTARVMEVTPPVAAPAVVAKAAGASRNWGSLLDSRRHRSVAAATTSAASVTSEPRKAEPRNAEASLPAGFQDGFVLTRLMESRQPVSGLVVSIGASLTQDTNHSLPANVSALIQSLIGPGDFAAQSGKDEFLLIFPGERGASAQRRLSQIAEQLWDFQLRSMGALSILFSWGGLEVRSESIDEAIASATERMQETRRNRRVLTMESRPHADVPLRRAV